MAKPTPNTNVVRLPTAPRRMVQQQCNAGGRAARAALRKETPWPGEYIFPKMREAMKAAELLADIKPTPEMELLAAICAALDDTTRAKVVEIMAAHAFTGRRSAVQAYELLRSTRMTYGEANDLKNAMRRLQEDA